MKHNHISTHVIEGVAYEVYGEHEMYPLRNEDGSKVKKGYDYYDIFTQAYQKAEDEVEPRPDLVCLNEGQPFKTPPTETEIRDYLDIPKSTTDTLIDLWAACKQVITNKDSRYSEIKAEFLTRFEELSEEEREIVTSSIEALGV